MKTNDIATAFIAWPGGGKKRPIYVISEQENIVRFFKITSQYKNKSPKIKKKYFTIKHWSEAGLNKQSYIDTITIGEINRAKFDLEIIGRLIEEDAEEFVLFLEQNK